MSTAVARRQLPQRERPKPTTQLLEMLRAWLFLRSVVWFLKMYDDHWASRWRRPPDIHELARGARGENLYDASVPLQRKRNRALTNPLPAIESARSMSYSIRYPVRRSRQCTADQIMSTFMTKLPLEVRRIVYEQVLAGGDRRLVHILRKRGRLRHWRCRIQNGQEVCNSQVRRFVEGWLSYKAKLWHWDKQ